MECRAPRAPRTTTSRPGTSAGGSRRRRSRS
uniref:Uncharacterized protein n=1 Tax=Arundo donax TaxID=35708 RepID=A0A0A9A0N0_ARUDO